MIADSPPALIPQFPAEMTVKIVGLGGTGSIVSEYTALWLNAQATIYEETSFRMALIDGDAFEPSNSRMFFSRCGNKASVKREDLMRRLGDRLQRLMITATGDFVASANIERLIRDGDYVLLCVDSHASRKLVSDHFASSIRDGVLISAGNDGVGDEPATGRTLQGTFGNCQIYIRRNGEDLTPSLTEFHKEIEEPADELPADKNCTDLAASVPQLMVANFWAAASILSTFYLSLCPDGALPYQELAFDLALGRMTPLELAPPDRGSELLDS